jgi:hypothetical protein
MIRFGTPVLFVLIWSTGFVVARVAAPHADLQLFLVLRFALTAAVMGLMALAAGARWPRGRELWPHILAGALMQGARLVAHRLEVAECRLDTRHCSTADAFMMVFPLLRATFPQCTLLRGIPSGPTEVVELGLVLLSRVELG